MTQNKRKIILPVRADVPVDIAQALPLPPTTTVEQDKVVEAQRGTSLMWETTQMRIALWVVIGGFIMNSLVVVFLLILISVKLSRQQEITTFEYSMLMVALSNISQTGGIIIGFYFSRTNHTKVGGVGAKIQDSR